MSALVLWLVLAVGAEPSEAPTQTSLEDTGAEAPWGPGPQPWVSPLELEGLAAYHRYQRVALWGAPVFVSGLALGGWGFWAFEVGRINADQETFALLGGGLLAAGGAGFMTFGSYTAVSRLYNGKPPPLGTAAGYAGYGLLGISAAFLVTGGVAFFFYPPLVVISAIGLPIAAASGLPGLIQTAVNPRLRRRWEESHQVVRLSPVFDPNSRLTGVGLHASF